MSFYKKLAHIVSSSPRKHLYLKWFFNISPMYRRSTGRLIYVSPDLLHIRGRIKLFYKNMNYMGTLFGGSMLSATDPIYMVQLTQILGPEYVVWDKSVSANFKRPVKKTVFMDFIFTKDEIEIIKQKVAEEKEYTFSKSLVIKDENENVYMTLEKEIYCSTYVYYREKLKKRNQSL